MNIRLLFSLTSLIALVSFTPKEGEPGSSNCLVSTYPFFEEPSFTQTTPAITMYPKLITYLQTALEGTNTIPEERKRALEKIAQFVQSKKQSGAPANLNFICTHNSRRSHISQIWAAVAAHHFGIAEGIFTFSGGTEATAFNPRAVAAMERAGLKVVNPGGENPHYQVSFSEEIQPIECFSKTYNDPVNPDSDFVAVMTCSDADKNCPLIHGAALRVAIPYEDPKAADGTFREAATYDERCLQIATEMCYLMTQVSK